MPRVTLRVKSNPGLVALSEALPDVPFDVLGAWPTDAGLGLLVEAHAVEPSVLEATLDDTEEILATEIRHAGTETVLFEVTTPRPPPHGAMADSGVVPRFPQRVAGGWITGDLVASTEQLAAFRAELDDADVEYRVTRVTAIGDAEHRLTDRQREVLDVAVAAGYYDVPRDSTLTGVADRLGVNKSVVSRVLHRAEARIVTDYWANETADGAPADSVPGDGAPADSVPGDGAPADSVPGDGAHAGGVPAENAPEDR